MRKGGALLEAAGPNFGTPLSLYRTPLGAMLPAEPTGNVFEQGFVPQRHRARPPPSGDRGSAGRRTAGRRRRAGAAGSARSRRVSITASRVMTGDRGEPLLVLDRVGKGRVAQLLSDEMWLWARGFEGGGPQAELLRRLAYWLMKEPDLEENDLRAAVDGNRLVVTRQSLEPDDRPVTGDRARRASRSLKLTPDSGGRSTGTLAIARERALPRHRRHPHRARRGGRAQPDRARRCPHHRREAGPGRRGDRRRHLLGRLGHDPRHPPRRARRNAAGRNWMGLRANGDYIVTGFSETPLLPAVAALLLIVGGLLAAWRREGMVSPVISPVGGYFVLRQGSGAAAPGRVQIRRGGGASRPCCCFCCGARPAGRSGRDLWMVYFFRDPWRVTPLRDGPAGQPGGRDRHVGGTGAAAARARDGRRGESARIGIFLNIFDVHVNRAPIDGRVAALRYSARGDLSTPASTRRALNNERMAIRLAPAKGPTSPLCRSPASSPAASSAICARASASPPASASASSASARGSMFIVPPPYVTMVAVGQRMVGGETVIADRLARGAAAAGRRALRGIANQARLAH